MEIHTGDCIDVMREMPDNSVDAIVTDPPYGLSFMGAKWDNFADTDAGMGRDSVEVRREKAVEYAESHKGAPRYGNSHKHMPKKGEMASFQHAMEPIFAEVLRVAKPGAYLLCFGGTRTFHRMACAIEDAGWEIRDCIMWVYGSGFPKSMDVAKAIDKAAGVKGEKIGERRFGKTSTGQSRGWNTNNVAQTGHQDVFAPATEAAKEWQGWGTCLKPAWEPIIVARKPLDGTVAHNVTTYGTGAINIDACRVEYEDGGTAATNPLIRELRGCKNNHNPDTNGTSWSVNPNGKTAHANMKGRFPANLVHDGSEEVVELFPDSKGQQAKVKGNEPSRIGDNGIYGRFNERKQFEPRNDSGSAARFFYCAKASKKDRGEGNNHPTVKPTLLMRWLVRLVCRQGGTVLDPFMGSGSTGVACIDEGIDFIGIEKEPKYVDIAEKRIAERQRETERKAAE